MPSNISRSAVPSANLTTISHYPAPWPAVPNHPIELSWPAIYDQKVTHIVMNPVASGYTLDEQAGNTALQVCFHL